MMELDPETNSKISVKLFKNVSNAKELKKKLMSGELQCCIIKPSLIVDPFQVVIAANKAITSEKLTTKSIFTEILFNLSSTKNITHSLQTFGIDDKDSNLLVVTVIKEDTSDDLDIYKQIDGVEVDLQELKDYSDINLIKKTYKISDNESNITSVLDSVVSRIATKDFVSF